MTCSRMKRCVVPLVATLSRIRAATEGREIVALSFGSQLDGLVAAGADVSLPNPERTAGGRSAGPGFGARSAYAAHRRRIGDGSVQSSLWALTEGLKAANTKAVTTPPTRRAGRPCQP